MPEILRFFRRLLPALLATTVALACGDDDSDGTDGGGTTDAGSVDAATGTDGSTGGTDASSGTDSGLPGDGGSDSSAATDSGQSAVCSGMNTATLTTSGTTLRASICIDDAVCRGVFSGTSCGMGFPFFQLVRNDDEYLIAASGDPSVDITSTSHGTIMDTGLSEVITDVPVDTEVTVNASFNGMNWVIGVTFSGNEATVTSYLVAT